MKLTKIKHISSILEETNWWGGGRMERYLSRSDWYSTEPELLSSSLFLSLYFYKTFIRHVSASDQILLLSVDGFFKVFADLWSLFLAN